VEYGVNQTLIDPERARAAIGIGKEQSLDTGTGRDEAHMNIDCINDLDLAELGS
jgi:hypothetical protein